jgi:phosphatidylserine/phosphatidylglycerophosphate/cardiolipin synthase-like enzyme
MRVIKNLIVITIIFIAVPGFSGTATEVYFSPNGGCQEVIIKKIKSATDTIDIAMYYFTSVPIAEALAKAEKRGVEVRMYLDKSQRKGKWSKSSYLAKNGVEIRYKKGNGLMHHKFAVIDEKVLITGSYNWTKAAEGRNDENLLVIYDEKVVKRYLCKFKELWNAD